MNYLIHILLLIFLSIFNFLCFIYLSIHFLCFLLILANKKTDFSYCKLIIEIFFKKFNQKLLIFPSQWI